jgi:hypothetical protein
MARPKGSKTDPIGTVIVRCERDLTWAMSRLKSDMKKITEAKRIAKRLGIKL